jgi:hypothetical protein
MNSLIVKFGQQVVCQQHIPVHQIQKDWTDNKTYKLASDIGVECSVDLGRNCDININSLLQKMKNNRNVLENISNSFFTKSDKNLEAHNNFKEFSIEFVKNKNKDDFLKSNLMTITKTATGFKNIEYKDLNTMDSTYTDDAGTRKKKIMEIVKKYKNEFLKVETYGNLNNKERYNLMQYLDKEEKAKNGVHDINDFSCISKTDITNKSHNKSDKHDEDYNSFNNFSLFAKDDLDLNKNNSTEQLAKLVLCEEFRALVNNNNLNDDQVLKYFNISNDMTLAAEKYFQEVYGSNTLRLTLNFPNQSQHHQVFNFTTNPEHLFLYVYSKFPEANDPKIYRSDHKQIIINPVIDKFIGALGIPQNSVLRVQF